MNNKSTVSKTKAKKIAKETPRSTVKEYSFFQDVYDVARQVPKGRVTSYGAIAAYLQELRPRLQAIELLTAKADRLDRITNSRSWQFIGRCIRVRRKFLDFASLVRHGLSRPATKRTPDIELEHQPVEKIRDEVI